MKIKNSTVESTPFVHVVITDKARNGKQVAWFQLYWTDRAGVYGHQVCFRGSHGDYEKNYYEGKTNGCGYSKPCQALQTCIARVIGSNSAYTCHYGAHHLFHGYGTGGNHYKISMAQLRKACKAIN